MREKSKDPRCSHRNDVFPWFEYTSDRKGERCTSPCASTHHIIFPQPWMRPLHREPPLPSESQSQNLSQHVFYTVLKKKLFGVCTEQNPQGGLSSGCKSRQSFRESFRERDAGCFSEKTGKQHHITLSPSCGLKVFSYFSCKLVSCPTGFTFVFPDYCFVLMNIQIHLCFCQ